MRDAESEIRAALNAIWSDPKTIKRVREALAAQGALLERGSSK